MRSPAWVLLALLWVVPARAAESVLYFYNWADYLPESVLTAFTKETGIRVVYTTYDGNEAMYAKVKLLDGGGYDLVVPSTYYVSRMRREGLLRELDRAQLPNFSHLEPRHLDQAFDPGNRYSVPYLWGTTGIAANAAVVDTARLKAWADLWEPRYKGRLLLLNDLRDVFMVALHVLGYSGNTTDAAQIQQAYEKLRQLAPGVRVYNSDSPKVPYLAGETDVGMIWNGEVFVAAQEDSSLVYIYPREGAILWMDSLVIPKRAKHLAEAHAMINYLLRPEVARAISEEVGYASPNRDAVALMPAAVRANRTVYPTPEQLAGAEYQLDIGEAVSVYNRYWELLKAGH